MKGLCFFILSVFLFLGCSSMDQPTEGQTSQTASKETGETMGAGSSSGAMELGAVTEDIMDQMSKPKAQGLEAKDSTEEGMAAKVMEDKILKEATQQSGMIASVPDGERERIINENRWGYAVRNLDAGGTMYYDRNGNFLGKRLQ